MVRKSSDRTRISRLKKREILPVCEGTSGESCPSCPIGQALHTNKVWPDFLRERVLQEYELGSTIFHQGNVVGFVFMLFEGFVKLSINDGIGGHRVIAVHSATQSPCMILDPLSLDQAIHSYTCEALSDCRVYCLPKPAFLWFMREEFNLVKFALSEVSRELEMFLERAKREVNTSGRERLAHLLLSLLYIQGPPEGEMHTITLPLNRQELASMIGVTRETFSRLLRGLTQSGAIALSEDDMIIIRKLEQLSKIAGPSQIRN